MRGGDIYLTGRDIYFEKGHNFVTNYYGDEIFIMCTNPKQLTNSIRNYFLEIETAAMFDQFYEQIAGKKTSLTKFRFFEQ